MLPSTPSEMARIRGATEMKPIRKTSQVVDKYPTFVTAKMLEDALVSQWQSMNLIGDEDEVIICLPDEIPVTIQVKKGTKVRTKYRILNNGKT